MIRQIIRDRGRWWPWLLLLVLLGGYWLLPIRGRVVVVLGEPVPQPWPQMRLHTPSARPGDPVTLQVTDSVPWANVMLTVDGRPAHLEAWQAGEDGTWHWTWSFTVPESSGYVLTFYHDCDTGCVERGRMVVGQTPPSPPPRRLPTKLGLVFASPTRDWYGRSGWAVDLTYVRSDDAPYWGVDALAERVYRATAQGLRVLVRVDYAPGQSIPPKDDYLALTEYLTYLERLARDDRLRGVYGYFLGSGYNALDANRLAPDRP
ncbi:MAG TPA: hypothetical protein ENK56_06900, partial [Chloroflexi bacterium]|nr:hypothetical protein [Chloroflexota bacterium]